MRVRASWLAAAVSVAAVLGLGLGVRTRVDADPPAISRYACEADTDCVIVTSLPSCNGCATCEGARTSVARRYVEERTRTCRGAARPGARPTTCPPCPTAPADTSPVEAVCRERMCTLRDVAR